jgi:branched-chain amino acid transport system permease protein
VSEPTSEGGIATKLRERVERIRRSTDVPARAPGGQAAIPSAAGGPKEPLIDRPGVRRAFNMAALVLFFYFLQQFFWPAPIGVLVQGTIIGSLTALIAFGIALIYRSNRIINFAQGDLGAAPAVLTVLLIVGPGLPYFLALPIGLAAAISLGALVEVIFIRRFFKAPRLILTVVTLGLTQLLAGLGLILPSFFDITTPPQSFPSPFDFSFTIHPIVFRGNDVIAMLAVPTVIAALFAFFRYTNMGIAVRASAESSDRALLLGVPVKRVQMIVWIIASVLATLAIFLRAGIVGLPIGSILGPAILLRALAAAVIGRMERLPTIFVAAVGLGIIEQSIVWHTGRALLAAPIIFVIVMGALLLQRRGTVGRTDEGSTWQSIKDVRPIPRELKHLPEVRFGLKVPAVLIGLFLLVLPTFMPESRVNLVAVIAIFAIIGVSLVVLTGWAGQISLGQIAFVGFGAAVGGSVTTRLGWDIGIALVLAGLAGALIAVLIGIPALRIRGFFLAVATLAFAQATASYFLSNEFFGWWLPSGRITRPPLFGLIAIDTEVRYYYFTLACLAIALLMARGIRESRTGRILIGVRENERAAQAYGVNVTAAKLTAFAISGFLAAFAGALFVHHQQGLGITAFATEASLAAFVMIVVGGLASLPGALIGAFFVRGVTYFLPQELSFFTSGIGLILILWLLPGGLGSLMYQARDGILRQIAIRRRIIVPSLFADVTDVDKVGTGRRRGQAYMEEMAAQMLGRSTALSAPQAGPEEAPEVLQDLRRATEEAEDFAEDPTEQLETAGAAAGAGRRPRARRSTNLPKRKGTGE